MSPGRTEAVSPMVRAGGCVPRDLFSLAPSCDPGMLLHYLGLSCPTCKAFMLALALQKAFLGCEQIPSLKYHVAAITTGDLGWGFGKIKCCSTDMCILGLLW